MLLLNAMLFFAHAFLAPALAQSDCRETNRKKTVSVTMGFDYKGASLPELPGSVADREFYRKTVGEAAARQGHLLTDKDAAKGKTAILAKLKSLTSKAEFVNFNFTGHGFVTQTGEFAIALPTMPRAMIIACLEEGVIRKPEQLDRRNAAADKPAPKGVACTGLENHMISQKELRDIFGSKKVFGFADACHSGGLDLGPNSMMVSASRRNELAAEDTATNQGAFTKKLQGTLLKCAADRNKDGFISIGESAQGVPHENGKDVRKLLHVPRSQRLGRITEEDNVQNPVRTGAMGAAWSSCAIVSPTSGDCGAGGSGTGNPAAARTPSRRQGNR